MDEKKKEFLKLIGEFGKINLDEAEKRLEVDRKVLYVWAEEMKKKNIVRIEPHFIKAPDIIATERLKKATDKVTMKVPTKVKSKVRVSETGEIEIDSYTITLGEIHLPIRVLDTGDYVYHYNIAIPHIDFVTRALLDETKRSLVGEIQIETHKVLDQERVQVLKTKFFHHAKEKIKNVLKSASDDYAATLSRVLVNEMMGLGEIEYLLADNNLEEITVNSSKEVVWVYHKQHGWVKTNITIPTEEMVLNYSSRIAREIGREITHMEPLLDAHLATGDRVNATLFPISSFGNTITIRRFSRTPWTVIHLMAPERQTLNVEVAAFLWMAIEHELSMLIAGGTASGKTTMLNALMPFMPPNQRILSIEDTRELNLPGYLHWVPLTIRPPNPHGEGEVSMLDLIQNALRMRPDRIIVGEVRRKRETEVLFEAMHTGHSVYGTFHAEQAYEVVDRITTPPMNIPGTVLSSLHLIVVQYRNRRTGARRTFEVVELTKSGEKPELNTLYRWNSKTDRIEAVYPSVRVNDELKLFTGMDEQEIQEDLAGKQVILNWLLKKGIKDVNDVGKIVAEYYIDKETVLDMVAHGRVPEVK